MTHPTRTAIAAQNFQESSSGLKKICENIFEVPTM